MLITFAIASSFVFAGNRPSCDQQPVTLTCNPIPLQVDPGACVEINNPCGTGSWVRLDSFNLCDPDEPLFIRTERSPRARFLCASVLANPVTDLPVDFYYVTPTDSGEGTLTVTIGAGMSVQATATPPSIPAGGSTTLDAIVTGGTPPLSYAWNPVASLDDPTVASPVATPANSTNYTVTVTDANGIQAVDTVTVNVGVAVVVSATPSTIDAGQTSALLATVSGGTPPFTYDWTPAATLDDATIAGPTASPTHTTTYDVTVTDALGQQAFGSATVTVNIVVTASANPTSINPGDQSQLGCVVTGGLPPYSFNWTPAGSLDDATAEDPIASPGSSTTYVVVVTDSAGSQGTATTHVDVTSSGLTADLSVIVVAPVAVQIDASGSSPQSAITEYRYWCDYSVGVAPDEITTNNVSDFCAYDDTGPKVLRVEVTDGISTDAVEQTVIIPL